MQKKRRECGKFFNIKPDDFVIATGKQYSVKHFINKVLNQLGISFYWKGKGFNEKCYSNDKILIRIDKRYFRPNEVDSLKGKSDKIKKFSNFMSKILII